MPRKENHGFTLVELLVVIAMISLLAAMVFPAAYAALARAHRSACAHNMQEIAQGVELYRQDGEGYPGIPDYIGENGIPDGGVTALALSDNSKNTENYFWCRDDKFPKRFKESMWDSKTDRMKNSLMRDDSYSSYDYGYNYYGYVTTVDGFPFPITTPQAAAYFYGKPKDIDKTLASDYDAPEWNLALVKQYLPESNRLVMAGLFPGLANNWAPQSTIVTFCPHHLDAKGKGQLPLAMLDGSVRFITAIPPMDNDKPLSSANGGFLSRKPDGDFTPAIDWRINKAAYTSGDEVSLKNFGDSPNSNAADEMPLVYVNKPTFFKTSDLSYSGWYNTRVEVDAHDVIMVVAHAKWTYNTGLSGDATYKTLLDGNGNLFFTAGGDRLATSDIAEKAEPRGKLIGRIGGGNAFALGSRGSYIVQAGEKGTLYLGMNDPDGNDNNAGWCEAWVALYRP